MTTEPRQDNLAIVRANVQMFGLWRTLGDIIGYLFTGPVRDRFDARYGVRTAGNVATTAAGITDTNALVDAIRYVPISEQVMRHMLAGLTRVADPASLAFVDLGCGKGRALVMASWFPFRSILGVELSPQHAELAERNARDYLAKPRRGTVRCDRVTVACANALHVDFPEGDLLIFMHRPFRGHVFQGVIDRLHQLHEQTGRRVLIAYACPMERAMLERHPGFSMIQDVQVIVDEYRWSLWETRKAPALPVSAAAS